MSFFNKLSNPALRLTFLIAALLYRKEVKQILLILEKIDRDGAIYPIRYHYALVFVEDKRFFSHIGVDFFAICRAAYFLVFNNKLEGASTIEQQLVRTILKEYDISLRRKFKEQVLAYSIAKEKSKYEIAAAYLNIAYIGNLKREVGSSNDEISYFISAIKYPIPKVKNLKWQTRFLKRKERVLNYLNTLDKLN